uniref:M-phase-specific PLK1-interacting protein n=1 Tax=Ciona savignyi TaxID=51511 RepID=H2YE84_CIOSA
MNSNNRSFNKSRPPYQMNQRWQGNTSFDSNHFTHSPNQFSPNPYSPNPNSPHGYSPNPNSTHGYSPKPNSPHGYSPNPYSPNHHRPQFRRDNRRFSGGQPRENMKQFNHRRGIDAYYKPTMLDDPWRNLDNSRNKPTEQ